jgi:hypothetical protein
VILLAGGSAAFVGVSSGGNLNVYGNGVENIYWGGSTSVCGAEAAR